MPESFAAQVGAWANSVKGAGMVILQEAAQDLVEEMDRLLVQMVYEAPPAKSGYKRTGFLRASLVASKTAMPTLSRPNPGHPVQADYGDVVLMISSLEPGQTLYLGVTANYGAFVHYGAQGTPPKPWVTMAAQKWPEIVDRAAERVKARLGL